MKNNFENDVDIFSSLFEIEEEEKINPSYIKVMPPKKILDKYNSTTVDNSIENYIDTQYKINYDRKVEQHEIDDLLKDISSKFNDSIYDDLINQCKSTVMSSIVGPFGLGKVLNTDKNGGNVTTLHNFNKQVEAMRNGSEERFVATDSDFSKAKDFVDSTKNYDRTKYEKGNFKIGREKVKKQDTIIDAYTGKELKNGFHYDHVVSAKEINDDPKNYLFMSESERIAMATHDKNLKPTAPGLNTSKNDKNLKVWENEQATYSPKGVTNSQKYGTDKNKTSKIDKEARNYIKKTQLRNQINKQGKELVSTGVNQGLMQGSSQAIGVLLSEFTESVFFEIKDIMKYGFKNGNLDTTFIEVLKFRLNRIKNRILDKWKDAIIVFKDGLISGFLSNLVTTIINSFKTTSKKIVRIIREGFSSLCKALKLLLNPPKEMTMKEVLHEASKLFAVALVTSGGILIEEHISKYMDKIPFGDKITSVIMGIITGITTVVVVYMIDKLVLLGVNRKKIIEYTNNELDIRIEENIKYIEESLVF